MRALLMLLGLGDPGGHGTMLGGWQFPNLQPVGMPLVFLLLIAAGGVLAWRVYHHEPSYLPLTTRRALTAMRLGSYLVVAFMFTGALVELSRAEPVTGSLLVLIDHSRSMGIVDHRTSAAEIAAAVSMLGEARKGEAATATRTDLVKATFANTAIAPLAALAGRFDVEAYTFGESSTISPLALAADGSPGGPFARLMAPTEDATQLGSALLDARVHARGRTLDGVIVITDGGSNRGEDPVLAAKAIGVPVYALGIGLPLDKDLEIPYIACDDLVFKDDHFPLTVRIRQRGYAGRSTTLRIVRSDASGSEEVVQEQAIVLGDEAERTLTLDMVPDRAGVFTYRAELSPFPDQVDTGNNRRAKEGVRVVDQKIRVLLVEDSPRFEFRFLKAILEADRQRIAPSFILRRGESLGHGAALLRHFPGTIAELHAFDVVILGDVAADFFSPEDLQALETFVRQDGGGLIAIAGDTSMPASYVGTPLMNMLPVEVDALPPLLLEDDLHRTISDGFRVQPTPAGERWPALRFAADPAENQRDWERAEPLTWFYPARALKPAASVLLANPDRTLGTGPMPILTSQRYGKGQVLFLASDEDWRWRSIPGSAAHRRLWDQLVSAVAMAHLLGSSDRVQVETERTEYAVGDHVPITARVRDADYAPSTAAAVTATIERELSRTTLELGVHDDQPGVFSGEWVPTATGRYTITVESGGERAERTLAISVPRLEFEDVGQHQELLERMATVSGGRYLPLEDAGKLAELLTARPPATNLRRSELTLWNAPGILLLLGVLLGAEWLLRKRADLL